MVGPRLRRDAEITAKEGRAEFGNQFLGGIALGAKAPGEITIKATLRAGPVDIMPISA